MLTSWPWSSNVAKTEFMLHLCIEGTLTLRLFVVDSWPLVIIFDGNPNGWWHCLITGVALFYLQERTLDSGVSAKFRQRWQLPFWQLQKSKIYSRYLLGRGSCSSSLVHFLAVKRKTLAMLCWTGLRYRLPAWIHTYKVEARDQPVVE